MADSSPQQNASEQPTPAQGVGRRGVLAAAALLPLSLAGIGAFAAVRASQDDGSAGSPAVQSKRREAEESVTGHLSQAIQALPLAVAAPVLKQAKTMGLATPADLPSTFKGSSLSLAQGQKKALEELQKALEENLAASDAQAPGDFLTGNLWRWAAIIDNALPSPSGWDREDDYGFLQRPSRLGSKALTDDGGTVDIPALSDAYKCLDDIAALILAGGKIATDKDEKIDLTRASQHWIARRRTLGFAMTKIEKPTEPRAHLGKDYAESEQMALEDYKKLMNYAITQWPSAVPLPLYNVYVESLSLKV